MSDIAPKPFKSNIDISDITHKDVKAYNYAEI